MFKKDDKVKVVKGIKAFEGLSGTVLDTNGNQVKVKLNLSNDSELQKNLINVFEAYQLELESLDLLKEDSVSFDNDVEPENINENVMWTFQCEEESALGVAEAKNALLCTEDGYTGIDPHEACSVNYDDKLAYVTYIPKDKVDLDNAEDYVIVTEFPIEEFFDYGKWYRKVHNMEESKEGKQVCCICGEEYTGYGNNAEPYKEGYCCDECSKKFVIPSRLNQKSVNEGYKEELKSTINDLESALRAPKTSPKYSDLIANYTTVQNARKELKELKKRYSDLTDKKESLKLTEEELKAWCSDNDANYYTQDIKDDKVIIRGLNEDLAEYNFKTKELTVFDYSGTTSPETKEAEDDDNYIRDYVYDIDMIDEKTEIPSWEFASVIATAEDTTEDAVVTEAHDRGFKVFLITASEYEKLVVASEKITEEDIMDDFAAYLEGNPKVTEVI